MKAFERRWSVLRHVCVLACVLTIAAIPGIVADDSAEIPERVRQGITAALRERVSQLLGERNEDGMPYKRGIYSKTFSRVDDGTYQVSFHEGTAYPGHVETQRLQLTLAGSDNDWKIADVEVQDTVTSLYRAVPGDEDFFTFDTFTLEREGLKFVAKNGSLVRDYFNEDPYAFIVIADQMSYDYVPPRDAVSQYYTVYEVYKSRSKSDFVFDPKHFTVVGDPATIGGIFDTAFDGLKPATEETVAPRLAAIYDELIKRRMEVLSERPFSGYSLDWDPDREQLWMAVSKKGDSPLWQPFHEDARVIEVSDHAIWLRYDSWEPKEVGFHVSWVKGDPTFYSPILHYYSEQTLNSGIDPYELEYRSDPNNRHYHVQRVTGEVEMAVRDAEEMVGDITVTLQAKEELTEARFFIARERPISEERAESRNPTMFVNSIQDADGQELTWVRDSPFSGLVLFPEPIAEGTSFDLRMQFSSRGSIYKLNPSFSFVDRGGWLPFVRFADIIDSFDLYVSVPSKYTVLGVGSKLEDKVVGDLRVTRWATDQPVMFPSVTFGDYISATPGFDAKHSDGTVIPITVYVDKQSTRSIDSQASMASGAREIRGKQLKSIAEQAANSINLYREIFGVDYPYDRLDLVADPLGMLYGQAPSSLVYLGFGVFRGEGTVAGGAGFGGGTGTAKFLKSVVAHEVAHQWWGSAIVNNSTHNYWFVESLAEYASALYLENVYGPKEYQEQVDEWRNNILDRDMTVNVQDASNLATPDFNYQAAVYSKGPYAFHILRQTFGDEKLYKFLKMLAQSLEGKEIATRDIQKIAEQAYGVPMEWFFDQWIRGVGIPEYELEYTTRRTEDGTWLVQGTVTQRVVIGEDHDVIEGQYYLGAVPVTVTVRKSKKEYQVPIRIEGAKSQFAFKVPEEPLEVSFNKYQEILAHDIKEETR